MSDPIKEHGITVTTRQGKSEDYMPKMQRDPEEEAESLPVGHLRAQRNGPVELLALRMEGRRS